MCIKTTPFFLIIQFISFVIIDNYLLLNIRSPSKLVFLSNHNCVLMKQVILLISYKEVIEDYF